MHCCFVHLSADDHNFYFFKLEINVCHEKSKFCKIQKKKKKNVNSLFFLFILLLWKKRSPYISISRIRMCHQRIMDQVVGGGDRAIQCISVQL